MINRRRFLQMLSATPIVPVALDLRHALADIPEPTVEKIVNYVEAKRKIITSVVELKGVKQYSINFGTDIIRTGAGGALRRNGHNQIDIIIKHDQELSAALVLGTEYCFTFDGPATSTYSERVCASGYLVGVYHTAGFAPQHRRTWYTSSFEPIANGSAGVLQMRLSIALTSDVINTPNRST